MIKPDSSELLPTYDIGGRLSAMEARLRGAGTATPFVTALTYNARGQREYITYGNGSHTTYHYDEKTFRLTRLITTRNTGADILQDLNYTYDPVGNITEQIDNAQQTHYFNNVEVSPNGKYEYDPLYRLLIAEGRELIGLGAPSETDLAINALPANTTALQRYTQQYIYDELGNVEQMSHSAVGGSWNRYYHYNDPFSNNRLLSTSPDNVKPSNDQYTYDSHGNMTSMPHLASMTWDEADRLQSATNGTQTSYYTYDGAGDRVRKVVDKGSGLVHERIYIGDWEVYREGQGGTVQVERETLHITDDAGRIALVDTETVGGSSQNFRYQFSNHLGSVGLELDDTAAIISYEEYHPFGTTSYRSGRNGTETSLKRYRYVGKERDEETGLYYYGARYYAAWLARFVSTDPLKDDYPYYSSYQYAGNKPITFIDLDGKEEASPPLSEPPIVFEIFNASSNTGFRFLELLGFGDDLVKAKLTKDLELSEEDIEEFGPELDELSQEFNVRMETQISEPFLGFDDFGNFGLMVEFDRQAVLEPKGDFGQELLDASLDLLTAGSLFVGGAKSGRLPQIAFAQGRAFEKKVVDAAEDSGIFKEFASQVSLKLKDGTLARFDAIGQLEDGTFRIIEAKFGAGRLSKNQRKVLNALNAGEEITPVGEKARQVFGKRLLDKNVTDKIQKTIDLNNVQQDVNQVLQIDREWLPTS